MRPGPTALVAGLLLAGLAGCAEDPSSGLGSGTRCEMRTVAELSVLNDHGSPIVQAAINGTKVAFIVDTGARTSIIFEEAASRLGLPSDPDAGRMLRGIGGVVMSHLVTVQSFSLGTAMAHHQEFDSIPGWNAGTASGLPVVGLFGGDFLANYDVEFDLPAHLVTLFEAHHCTDNLRPWPTGAFYRMPFALDDDTAIRLRIGLDGHEVPVILDSGAHRTIIDIDTARAGGVTRAAMEGDRAAIARGIDANRVATHIHRFDTLDIGAEHFAPAFLEVGDIEVDGLLGADFFRSRKVWISYPHQVVYVQRVLFPKHREGTPTLQAGVQTVPSEPARH